MGWEPDDIDIVINTHLHCDHSGSNREFKNAKFYVQKKEWEAAFNPLVPEAPFYDKLCYDKNAVNYFQWNFLEGGYRNPARTESDYNARTYKRTSVSNV